MSKARFSACNGSLEGLLLSGPYHIPEQQRDFEWNEENGRDFIQDPGKIFLSEQNPNDSLEDIKNYSQYPFNNMTIDITDGRKNIIDGYQRMSVALLTAMIFNQKLGGAVSWIQNLIFTDDYGKKVYRITSSDEEFMSVLDSIYNNETIDTSKLTSVSATNLYNLYKSMYNEYPTQLDGDNLLKFAYFLFKNSFLTWSESRDANTHAMFDGANHRGKGVEDYPLFKNDIMGRIEDKEKKKSAGLALKTVSDKLHKQLPNKNKKKESPSDEFLTAILRGQYAENTRHNKKDLTGQWEDMTKPYKWASDNFDTVTDDPYIYATEVIPKFAELYIEIHKAMKEEYKGLESVHHANALNVPWFSTVLLSVVNYNNDYETNLKHINMCAEFFASYIARRTFNDMPTINGSFMPTTVTIIKQLRGLSTAKLALTLEAILDHESTPSFNVEMPSYNTAGSANLNRLRTMLMKAEDTLRRNNQLPSILSKQISGRGAAKLSLDHAMPQDGYDKYKELYPTIEEYSSAINKFGNLTLATGSANSGWGNMSLDKKLTNLGHQSILGATLNAEMFNENGVIKSGINAGLRKFFTENNIVFPIINAEEGISKTDIDTRTRIVEKLIAITYSNDNIYNAAGISKEEAQQELNEDEHEAILQSYSIEELNNSYHEEKNDALSAVTSRMRELIAANVIEVGEELLSTGTKYAGLNCTVNEDGTLTSYGEICFSTASAANKAIVAANIVNPSECKSGWDFWGKREEDKIVPLIKIYQNWKVNIPVLTN